MKFPHLSQVGLFFGQSPPRFPILGPHKTGWGDIGHILEESGFVG